MKIMKVFVGWATCCLEVKMVRKRSCLAFLSAIKLKISVWLGSKRNHSGLL